MRNIKAGTDALIAPQAPTRGGRLSSNVSLHMKPLPRTNASEELVSAAESELGIRLPDALKEAWLHYNCIELRGGWRVFPVFDPSNARKTCNSIVYENLKSPWGRRVMELGLLTIAENGTGNQLVLRVEGGVALPEVFHWHHATERHTKWAPGLQSIVESAKRSAENVAKLRKKFAGAG